MFIKKDKQLNTERIALALQYDGKDGSVPTISAIGQYTLADELVRVAKRFGVPVIERSDLVTRLEKVSVNEPIPEEKKFPQKRIFRKKW